MYMAKDFNDFVRCHRGEILDALTERKGGIRGVPYDVSVARKREAEEELAPILDALRIYHDWLNG